MSAAPEQVVTKKLLLIDDAPEAHVMLRRVMELEPPVRIELLGAMSFEGGMRIIRDVNPDICLLDLNFVASAGVREMRAPETIAMMRDSGLADTVPTLIITGHLDPERENEWGYGKQWFEARMAGACGYLRKDRYLDPRNREFLLHELSDAILEHKARRMLRLNPQTRTEHAA